LYSKTNMWNTHEEYVSSLCTTTKSRSYKIVYEAFQKCLRDKNVLNVHQKGGD